jgi:diaminohydroxyphosphoribosylaminopyrimidine deaminase/5-amino-6-(5-phosphoribosylamino)uracil reductase
LGAQVIEVPRDRHSPTHLDLAVALARLAAGGITTVLVEGGGGLASALLRAGLVDEIQWFCALLLIGSDGTPALRELGVSQLDDALRLIDVSVRKLGDDLHLRARVARPASARRVRGGKRGART